MNDLTQLTITANLAFKDALSQLIVSEIAKEKIDDEDSLLFQLNDAAATSAWKAVAALTDAHTARQAADLIKRMH